MDRREQLLRYIDVGEGPGLEFGPLDKPIVVSPDASVLYVDHASTDELRAKYRNDPNVSIDAIAPVDIEWAEGSLRERLGGKEPVRWVVASHVMEHVPDAVGWLGHLAEVLVPGGIVNLALPDGRFCFDAKRRTTDVSELIAAALTKRARPTPALTYDFWARMTAVDPAQLWAGSTAALERPDDGALGLEKARELLSSPGYQDIHCWVFTPQSFVAVVAVLMRLDLVPWYVIKDLRPTERGNLEFFVTLERLPPDLAPEDWRRRQDSSVASALSSLATADAPEPPEGTTDVTRLSDKERMMIELKRAALSTMRQTWRRLRGSRTRPQGTGSSRPSGS